MNISICIINKNQAENLDKCLRSLAGYDFELVVVDTGSSDNSIEIAGQYTDAVYTYEWNDNFADAKNYSVWKASNDIVITVDTDEFLTFCDYKKLVDLIKNNPQMVGRIERKNIYTRNCENMISDERISRIFDRRFFHYEGAIHEQVCRIDGGLHKTYSAPMTFDHTGYDGTPEQLEAKAMRNIQLLKKALEEKDDPYLWYQLGKSYFMSKKYTKACETFEKATSYDLDERLEYVIDLVVTYGYTLINLKDYEKALMFVNLYDDFKGSAEFVFLMGLIYMNNAMFDKAVGEFINATHFAACAEEGVNSYKAFFNIGVIYECLGETDKAREYYHKCNNYEKALARIKLLDGKADLK